MEVTMEVCRECGAEVIHTVAHTFAEDEHWDECDVWIEPLGPTPKRELVVTGFRDDGTPIIQYLPVRKQHFCPGMAGVSVDPHDMDATPA